MWTLLDTKKYFQCNFIELLFLFNMMSFLRWVLFLSLEIGFHVWLEIHFPCLTRNTSFLSVVGNEKCNLKYVFSRFKWVYLNVVNKIKDVIYIKFSRCPKKKSLCRKMNKSKMLFILKFLDFQEEIYVEKKCVYKSNLTKSDVFFFIFFLEVCVYYSSTKLSSPRSVQF